MCHDGQGIGQWKSCPECLRVCFGETQQDSKLDIYDSNNRKSCDCPDTPEVNGVGKRCMLIRVRSDDLDNDFEKEKEISTKGSSVNLPTTVADAETTDRSSVYDYETEGTTTETSMSTTETMGEFWILFNLKRKFNSMYYCCLNYAPVDFALYGIK